MARPPDPQARVELLDGVVAYLAEHGLGDATLRPMADSLGTSVNRLTHHFGSKTELLANALERVQDVQTALEDSWIADQPDVTQSQLLRLWWAHLTASRSNLNLTRLGLEAAAIDATVTGLAGEVRAEQIATWRDNIERRLVGSGVAEADARIEATMIKAVFTGLTLDLLATGDLDRLSTALDRALDRFDARLADLLDLSLLTR
jgi:AcrR family transcriptional regulator